MKLARRHLLRASGALAAFGIAPGFFPRALAQTPGKPKTLVVLFLRGGVDGLSMVPPIGEAGLLGLRPGLRLLPAAAGGEDAAVTLDTHFGLHPALAPLEPLYRAGRLAVVHAVGQSKPSRSHFDAQDFLESGTPGEKANEGWLNRAVGLLPGEAAALRAVAVQSRLPLSLVGPASAVAFAVLKDFKVGNPSTARGFEALYAQAVDQALRGAGSDAFDTMATLDGQKLLQTGPKNGAVYPPGPLGKRLQDLSRLIQADLGVQVCATEAGGFDTHLAQGSGKGQLSNRLKELGAAIAAFAQDLGPRLDDVCVVTMTEFGRTVRENGTRGTDHGTASALFVLGGKVKGGAVRGDWPGLVQLHEGRDLKVATDIRQVLAETLAGHLGLERPREAFPGFEMSGVKLGLF